ncbi:unnamed protein product [Orchesella dallaii]|uniref:Gustatory receptor n=1 Tax=Orchesella dallaii TaxID=48710 RepID=A0ABP1PRA8_9HEXA
MLGLVFLDCFVATLFMRTVFLFNEKDGLTMISSYLKFENSYPEVKTEKPDMVGRLLQTLGMCTSFGLPGFMTTMLAVDGCKPPHLGYMLYYSAEKQCEIPNYFARVGLLLFDYYMWTSSIAPACYYVFHFMFVGLRCMDHYIQFLRRILRNKSAATKQQVLPISEPQPQLESPQMNNTEAVLPTLKIVRQNIKQLEPRHSNIFFIYRQIQVMNKLYDEVLQAVFLPTIIGAACSCIIISLYACIKLHRMIPMPGLAFFPLLASDGFSVIYIVKVAAALLKQSEMFLETLRNNSKYSNKSVFKKVARSVVKIKVRFGSTNFIDQLTPFIFMDFCLTHTVTLMLVTS